jgi:5-oxoprolinase (ATP-hydrolysing) subunit C
MSAILTIVRAGPLTTIQDAGRFGMLRHGISASGAMDRLAYAGAGQGGTGCIEITRAGIELIVRSGSCCLGFAGGSFRIQVNGRDHPWPGSFDLRTGDHVRVTPGPQGNYGYLRFDTNIAALPMLGSISTSTRARLGGIDGRALMAGDEIRLEELGTDAVRKIVVRPTDERIRVVWGLHAELFSHSVRQAFLSEDFVITSAMDRMGVRLEDQAGVFQTANHLSLVSDAVVPGDIQILGNGTPIVLMRDHQPTGGYPRIATIITADFDRFAQMRPGTAIAFASVSVEHAQSLLRSRQS